MSVDKCTCHAHCSCECGCGFNWTDLEVAELKKRNAELLAELKSMHERWSKLADCDQELADGCGAYTQQTKRAVCSARASTRRMDCEYLERIIETFQLAAKGE